MSSGKRQGECEAIDGGEQKVQRERERDEELPSLCLHIGCSKEFILLLQLLASIIPSIKIVTN
jgi:hypothetical protein